MLVPAPRMLVMHHHEHPEKSKGNNLVISAAIKWRHWEVTGVGNLWRHLVSMNGFISVN